MAGESGNNIILASDAVYDNGVPVGALGAGGSSQQQSSGGGLWSDIENVGADILGGIEGLGSDIVDGVESLFSGGQAQPQATAGANGMETVTVTGQRLPFWQTLGSDLSNVGSDIVSQLTDPNAALSAVLDTGRGLVNGGEDVVESGFNLLSGAVPGGSDYVPFMNGLRLSYDTPLFGGIVEGAAPLIAGDAIGSPASEIPVTGGGSISDITSLDAITPTANSGFINSSLVSSNGLEIGVTGSENQALAQAIINGQDTDGTLTEQLVNNVAQGQGLNVLEGGEYGNNNGFDHVFQDDNGDVTILLDSKQFVNGSTSLSQGAGGATQLSNQWINNVLGNLDEDSPAYQAVTTASENGSLYTGVIGVDRTTGNLVLVRVGW